MTLVSGLEVLRNGLLAEGLKRGDFPPHREGVEERFGRYKYFLVSVGPGHGCYWLLQWRRRRKREKRE